MNLIAFLHNHNYDVCEINTYFISQYRKTFSNRKNKNDFIDSEIISSYLINYECKSYPKGFYHIYALKSLTHQREYLIKARSKQLIEPTNILDIIFSEFKPLFDNKLSTGALYILNKYKTPYYIANMTIDSYNNMKKELRRIMKYSKFIELKQLAKYTVDFFDDIHITMLEAALSLYFTLDEQIQNIEDLIRKEVLQLNPKKLGFKWFSIFYIATIISEYNFFESFNSPSKCLAFAGFNQIDINLVKSIKIY